MPLPLPPAELHSDPVEQQLPPLTGFLVAAATSLVLWAGIVAVVLWRL
jgi:hypothetical protein